MFPLISMRPLVCRRVRRCWPLWAERSLGIYLAVCVGEMREQVVLVFGLLRWRARFWNPRGRAESIKCVDPRL